MKIKNFIAGVITVIVFAIPVYAEFVFLKDGSIVEGKIVSDAAGSITIRDKESRVKTIQRGSIMRVLYTELYMGKVYVQKIDGKNVVCYMVDEDRESYTFRKELFNPEEFKLRRDQVLFIARGNPTGLEGEPDTDRVDLKWFAPYNPAKKYRIYIKGPGDKLSKLVDDTRSKNITLKNLLSNTKYFIYVTAIDDSGDESLPSNELAITTKNLPPNKPEISTIDKLSGGGAVISWIESTDPDGKLSGYRIYKKYEGKTTVIAELKKTGYTLTKDEKFDNIYITAFDDLKAESKPAYVQLGISPGIRISAAPSYLYPMGKLKDFADYGFGGVVKAEFSNYLFQNLELAAEFSFFYLPGGGSFTESESKVNYLYLMPLMINAGYAFHPFESLDVIPYLSGGGMILRYDYNYYDIPTSKKTQKVKNQINPVAGGGLNLRYSYTYNFFITLSADYRIFFEESGSFSYCSSAIGAGVRF